MSEISRNKVICPYCKNEIDLAKEKVWAYEPNDKIDEKCSECGKGFSYEYKISFEKYPKCGKNFSYEYEISCDITSWKNEKDAVTKEQQ